MLRIVLGQDVPEGGVLMQRKAHGKELSEHEGVGSLSHFLNLVSNYADESLAIGVALAGLLRLAIFSRLSDGELVKRIPDDAFYYLALARNFARSGRWTFDGVEPATGFHLLWGYLLALYFRIVPDSSIHSVLEVAGVFQVCCLALAAYLAANAGRRILGEGVVPGVAIIFFSMSCLQQGGWLMESAVTIVVSSAVVWLLGRARIKLRAPVIVGAALLGFFLMLARSDSGLLPLIFFITHFILWRTSREDASMPIIAATTLSGAMLGLAVTVLHTHSVSGHWLQSSAQQKVFWAKFSPHSMAAMKILGLLLGANHRIVIVIRPLIVLCISWGAFQTIRLKENPERSILLCLVAVFLGYASLYQFEGDVTVWYIANFVVAAAVLTGSGVVYLSRHGKRVVYSFAVFMSACGFFQSLKATMPQQESMYRSGEYLHNHPEIRNVGSINAGIIGFFADDGVINLDGLVNDRILPYAKSGRLDRYIVNRKIGYIMDYPQIFWAPYPIRGGYADGKLQGCITSKVDLFPHDTDNNYGGDRIQLYKLDLACLQSD